MVEELGRKSTLHESTSLDGEILEEVKQALMLVDALFDYDGRLCEEFTSQVPVMLCRVRDALERIDLVLAH
jgi:hypothetical protein